MSRPLSWSWLCSRLSDGKKGGHARTRPCLAALEQLEDRVLLSTTLPIPLSNQSVNAVNAFLKLENTFISNQDAVIKLETDIVELKTNLTAAQADYLVKIDHDMVQVDNDLIGADTVTAGSGIDGILTDLAVPINKAIELESQVIPDVQSAREATNTAMGQLQQLGPAAQVVHPAAAVGYFLKIEGIEGEFADDTVFCAKNCWPTIAADANDLGPALGIQGAATPGPVGGLLQDLGVLTADAAPAGDLNGDGQADAFYKPQDTFIQGENSFLAGEAAYLQSRMKSGQIVLSAAAVDYFLKIDTDLVQIDTDLAGSASATSPAVGTVGAGVDGVLLNDAQTLGLSQNTVSCLNALMLTCRKAGGHDLSLEQEVADATISGTTFQPGLIDTKHKGEIDIESWSWGVAFAGMENNLIKLDSNLGPALGFQGSTTTPGPAGGLLQDSLALGADAGGTFPGAIVYPPAAVVDAFLKLEGTIIQDQNALVAAENAFLSLNVQLPPVIVSFFTNVNNDVLEIDSGLLGSPGGEGTPATPGIDDILVGLNGMSTTYVGIIQSLAKQVQSGQAAVTKDAVVVQKTGTVAPSPQALAFMETATEVIELKTQAAFAAISLNFAQIESQFIGLDPGDSSFIQDSKNIADGAAKGQAQE